MRTKEEWQSVVDDIRAVLEKHQAVIHGACYSEGIYGEIVLMDASEDPPSNTIVELCPGHFFVTSIGG